MWLGLERGEAVDDVLFDAALDVGRGAFLELLARDVLVKLDVTLRDARDNLGGHLGNLLALQALETVGHQPLTNKLLRELLLLLALRQALLIALGVEVA